jgi:hypothetical protein
MEIEKVKYVYIRYQRMRKMPSKRHGPWVQNYYRDHYYCETCGVGITKVDLENYIEKGESLEDALHRIATAIQRIECNGKRKNYL